MTHYVSITREQLDALLGKVHALMDEDAEALSSAVCSPINDAELSDCCDRLEAAFRFREQVQWSLRNDKATFSTLDYPDELAAVASRILFDSTENTQEHLDRRLASVAILEQLGEREAVA